MGTSSDLKFHSDGMLFTLTKCTFKPITLKKVSILYLKCPAKNTGFKLSYLDVLKKAKKVIYAIFCLSPLNSAIINKQFIPQQINTAQRYKSC